MRKLPVLSLLFLLLASVGVGFVGCAQDLPDIDRTQPRKLLKSVFRAKNADGSLREWYYRQTVIEVPFGSGLSFVGEQGTTEKIVWHITERFLFAYRSREYVKGSEIKSQRPDTGDYQGTAIAAYRIEAHFDVQRSYNPATGEQTNVIVENYFDRPWHQRKYFRVDFSRNFIVDAGFTASTVRPQAFDYIPETETNNSDKANISDKYIDVVNRVFLQPEIHQGLSQYYGRPIPMCWLYNRITRDCMGQTLKVRSSFMLAENRNYNAKLYNHQKMQKFGYFRTIQYTFDRKYGETEQGANFYINRWNLWQNEAKCADPKSKPSHAKCKTRKIPYHLNAQFPKDLKGAAKELFKQWNTHFREVAKNLSGKDQGDIFVLCPNHPVAKGDDASCGKEGDTPRIGDLRYNFLYWVDNPHRRSPLGYGPSAADPQTGEIVNAYAFIYGQVIDFYSNYATDLVRLSNGDLKPEDLAAGKHVASYLSNLQALRKANQSYWRGDMYKASKRIPALEKKGAFLKEMIKEGRGNYDWVSANLKKMENVPGAEAILGGELFKAFGLHVLSPTGQINDSIRKKFGPHAIANRAFYSWSKLRLEHLSKNNILMADFVDDSILARALKMKNQFKGANGKVDYTKVYKKLREEIFLAVSLHEVGHNLGLRHNFGASADALNFHDKFWELRAKTVPPGGKEPLPEYRYTKEHSHLMKNAIENGLREFQYTSIMDYGANFASDLQGLGKYDRAAILYGYGDLVQVFKKGTTPLKPAEMKSRTSPGLWHYTQLPRLVAGENKSITEQIKVFKDSARRVITEAELKKDKTLVEVPFRFCSDEYVGGSPDCYRFDQGADSFERVQNWANRYWNYYIFDAFKRGRLVFGVDVRSYLSRVYGRYFSPITEQYKHFVNDGFISDRGKNCGTGTWYQDPKCGEHAFVASVAALNFFNKVMQIPNAGCYQKGTGGDAKYTRFSSACPSKKEKGQIEIPLGVGRKMVSEFSWDQNGYEFYWKPMNIGAWWDKYLAVMALGDPYTRFRGVDSQADPRSFLINFNNFFGLYINNVVGAFIADQPGTYAPVVGLNGKFSYRDAMSIVGGDQLFQPKPDYGFSTPIDPDEQFTAKLLVGFLGAVYFSGDTNDQYFNESMKISVRGLSEAPAVPDHIRNDPDLYIELVDPNSNRIYYAAKVNNQSPTFSSGPKFFSVGYEYLKWIKNSYYTKDGKSVRGGVESWRVRRAFNYINIMMGWLRAGEYNRPR